MATDWPCPVCSAPIPWTNDACPACNAIISTQDKNEHLNNAWHATEAGTETGNAVHFHCPSCRGKLSIEKKYAGKKGKCSFCNVRMIVPSISDTEGLLADVPHTDGESVLPDYKPLNCFNCNRIIDSAVYFGPTGESLCMQCGKKGPPKPIIKQDWNYGFQEPTITDQQTPTENATQLPVEIRENIEKQQRPIFWPCPKCKSKIPGHSEDCPFCHAVITENDRELYRKQPRCERCNNSYTLGQEVCKICGHEIDLKNKTREVAPISSTTSPDQFLVGCLGYIGMMFTWHLAVCLGGFVLIGVLFALIYGIGAVAQIHPCIGWLAIGIIVWILIGSGGGSSGGTSATEGGVSTSNLNG